MSEPTVLVHRQGELAILTLNRPDKLNSWTPQLMVELHDAVAALTDDSSDVRVVVVHGSGKAFGAGGDMSLFSRTRSKEDPSIPHNEMQSIFTRIQQASQIFVAAVHGYCVGSSLVLAGSCDFRFCSEDARFVFPEVKMGMLPGIGAAHIAHTMNDRMLRYLIVTGQAYTVGEADRDGFVTKIVPNGQAFDSALDFARKLAGNTPAAMGAAKRIAWLTHRRGAEASIEYELAKNQILLDSDEVREKAKAFLRDRK
ncbi:hypothetical protein GCT19_37450 [Paraburkholderia sp. CNPSo 3155]|uniref:enoyl-CoA hydratase/isomerase family protein n=1 Tax=Paraburkholderia atlantica TaxID=2654982 RepID=UPI00128E0974|nr:enoyl-CoA hydratase/isomerase family protein [Paraburkholderia atlantica]MPW11169.1 hypothetical protein [Paraburkholderia atlantica]